MSKPKHFPSRSHKWMVIYCCGSFSVYMDLTYLQYYQGRSKTSSCDLFLCCTFFLILAEPILVCNWCTVIQNTAITLTYLSIIMAVSALNRITSVSIFSDIKMPWFYDPSSQISLNSDKFDSRNSRIS